MITKDVDLYCQKKYGDDIVHIFGTDTIASMPSWDSEEYAAKIVRKLFVPRSSDTHRDTANNKDKQNDDWIASFLAMTEQKGIVNFELFSDSHIPDISSTELREIIPGYTDLASLFSADPKFIIP